MGVWNLFGGRLSHTIDNKSKKASRRRGNQLFRLPMLETLESRFVLTGPALQGIYTDGMVALHASNDPYHQAPNEFIIQFDANQQIDRSSLAGITFLYGTQTVTPGYLDLGTTANQVIARFDGSMQEGTYTLQIAGTGSTPLKNVAGEKFNSGQSNETRTFVVNTAAQIVSVVPQPVTRSANGILIQSTNQIVVYFNQSMGSSVTNVTAYQLFNTNGTLDSNDDVFINPVSVIYNSNDKSATLSFATDIGQGNYRLRVGNAEAPVNVPTQINVTVPTDTFTGADAAGNTVVLGATNTTSAVISGASIQNTQTYNSLVFPGSGTEPGARDISLSGPDTYSGSENAIGTIDSTPGITIQQFNFKSIYGTSPTGGSLINQISEVQKLRIRQALSLWSEKLGIEFVETADQGWTFAVGDTQAIDTHAPSTAYRGIADSSLGLAVISSAQNWGASDFGSDFQIVALHEIGILLGLERNSDAPDSIMNGGIEDPSIPISLILSGDSPLPGYIDTTFGQVAQRPESRDIDLYKVALAENGTLRVQTIAQRLTPQASLLNTVITIYNKDDLGHYNLIARNDDYYGSDSYVEIKGLKAGDYYVAVTSTGNTNFNPAISDSGSGGTTEGAYQLRIDFDPAVKPNQIFDSTGLALDGDGDGKEGGEFNFWFQVGNTIFVDKANDKVQGAEGNGSAANPYDNIASAITAAANRIILPTNVSAIKAGDTFTLSNGSSFPLTFMFTDGSIPLPLGVIDIQLPANVGQLASNIATAISDAGISITASISGTVINLTPSNGVSVNLDLSGTSAFIHAPNIIRVIGNQSLTDNYSYLIGQGRADGSSIVVPQAVTLMIDAGAILKFDQSAIMVGDSQTNINRAGGAIQILGTPKSSVVLTSLYDDAFGGDVAGTGRAAAAADWAGVIFRPGSDHEKDGIFLNFIAGTTVAFGGGQGQDSNQQTAYSAVDITGTRPTIISSTLRQNAGAAISADPDSFKESNYGVNTTMNVDYSRLGLNVYGVKLALNGQNGLAIRSQSSPGSAAQEVTGTIHLNDTGIVHIVTQDLLLAQGFNGAIDVTYKGTSPYIAPNYVVLDSTASSVDDYYVGQKIDITDAAGNVIQSRKIIAYNGLTKRAIVDQAWGSSVLGVKPNQRFVISGRLATPGANLVIDGDTIVKLSNTRIDAQFGSQILAEGTADAPVIFTSILDDSYGAAGSFDTTGNGTSQLASAGNWAGVYFAPTSHGSFDYVRLSYAGGTSSVQGTVDSFNPIEINQAQVRIAHSTIANNLGGQASTSRSGLGTNVSSAIFVRGAQPVLVGNTILNSLGAAISIDASSLNNVIQGDTGRQTGLFGKYAGTDGNYGAIVVGNVLTNDQINGMNVRGGNLSTESIWDDTDIVHVVLNQITILNKQVYGGLRLLSTAAASLVVKFQTTSSSSPAGINASGTPLDIPDRIGGTLQIIGTPAHSVVMTTLADDTVGAGVDIYGNQMMDTNNDKGASLPVPGSWNGITIDQYANDRNVKQAIEQEAPSGATTDTNGVPSKAENLGTLAANINSGDENNRLGFVVNGSIAYDRPSDVDVYKFTAVAGTEVWLDIDKTWGSLGALLELVDANGNVLARSDGNDDASNTAFGNSSNYIQPLDPNTVALRMQKDSSLGPDTYSTNFINTGGNPNGVSRDPGMRVILPGQAGTSQTYYVRVRSSPAQAPTFNGINNLAGGLSSGNYELQVRLQQADETAGTTIRYADIRNAVNGISVTGQPSSPLTSTSGDSEGATGSGQNDTSATAQDLGNILASDQSTISINGYIAPNSIGTSSNLPAQDVDWYKFNVNYDFVQAIRNANDAGQSFSAIFDLDYGAGTGRIDTTISVYQQTVDPATGQVVLQLVLVGRDSNVVDDQANTANLSGNGSSLLSRGSQGNGDPFIGSVLLPAGDGQFSIPRVYYVAISSSGRNPTPLNQFYQHLNADNLVRLQPIDSVNIIASDHLSVTTPQLEDPRTSDYDNLYPTDTTTGALPTSPNNQAAAGNPLFGVADNSGTTTYKSSLTLGANATPLTLADITMWSLDSSGTLQILNPYTGQTEVVYSSGKEKLGNVVLHAMAMRPDGLIYAIADSTNPTSGANFVTINPSDGTVTSLGTISLQGNIVVSSLSALTFTGTDPGNANADGFTAVGVTSWGQYITMRARDGAANVDSFGLKQAINANRLAISTTTIGSQVIDGDTIVLTPPGQSSQPVTFELNAPLGVTIDNVPTNLSSNLILTININSKDTKIELDTHGVQTVADSILVAVQPGESQAQLARDIATALNNKVAKGTAFAQGNTLFVRNGKYTATEPLMQGSTKIAEVNRAFPDGTVSSENTAIDVVGTDADGSNLHFLVGKELADSIAAQMNAKLATSGITATSHIDANNSNQVDIDIPLSASIVAHGDLFNTGVPLAYSNTSTNVSRLEITKGSQVIDGSKITVTPLDQTTPIVFELSAPLGVKIDNAPANQNSNLILTININGNDTQIELATNGVQTVSGSVLVTVQTNETQAQLASDIATALNNKLGDGTAFAQDATLYVEGGKYIASGPLKQGSTIIAEVDSNFSDGTVASGNTAIDVTGTDANGHRYFLKDQALADRITTEINKKLTSPGMGAAYSHIDANNSNKIDVDIISANTTVEGNLLSTSSTPLVSTVSTDVSRFAILGNTDGSQVYDGDTFVISPTAANSQPVTFELNKPLGLTIVKVPAIQSVTGGNDPDLILAININGQVKNIELDTNGTQPRNGFLQVHISNGETESQLASDLAAALNRDKDGTAFAEGTTLFIAQGKYPAGSLSQGGASGVGTVVQVNPAFPDGTTANGNIPLNMAVPDTNGKNLHFIMGQELADYIAIKIKDNMASQGVVVTTHVDSNNPKQYDIDIVRLQATVVTNGKSFVNPDTSLVLTKFDVGTITGLAYIDSASSGLSGSRVYAVTNTGNFLVLDAATGQLLSIQNFANTSFTGLTRMPKNVEGAAFSDFLMASTSTRNLIPLEIQEDNSGNHFAVAQTTAVDVLGNQINVLVGGLSSVQNLNLGTGGIMFSPFDFNIWHATTERTYDSGHGIYETYDQSITQNTLPGDQGLGGVSYAFNLDTRSTNAAGDADILGPVSYGATDDNDIVGSVFRFRSDILDTYNLPGGTAGSLTTNTFSLAGYTAQDMPTLYFNYYLQTEDALAYNLSSTTMRDSLRVFVSDDGVTWHQVATNDSTPSNYYDPTNYVPPQGYRQSELPEVYSAQGGQYVGQSNLSAAQNSQTRVQELFDDVTAVSTDGGKSTPFIDPDTNGGVGNPKQWRQARIDLGDFAGMSNLRIRFDFSTAGDMQEPTKLAVTVPKVGNNTASQNLALLDGAQFSVFNPNNNQLITFELDTNNSLANPTAKKIALSLKSPGQQLTDAELAAEIIAVVNQYVTATNIGAMTVGLTGTPIGDLSTIFTVPQDPTVQGIGVNQNIIRFDLANSRVGTRAVLFLNTIAQQYFSTPQVTTTPSISSVFGVQPARLAEVDAVAGQFENLQGDSFGNYNSLSRAQNNSFEGAYIDDLVIGFASRGEMVTRPTVGLGSDGKFTVIAQPTNQDVFVNSPISPNPNAPKPATGGAYTLEIRPGVPYGTALTTYDLGQTIPGIINPGDSPRVYSGLANVILTNSFDINDRLTHSFNIVAKAGSAIFDGSSFSVNDGIHTVTFEFDMESSANPNGNGVTSGRVRIGYKVSDADWQIADKIALAIRSATTLGFRLDTTATTSNLDRAAYDKVLRVDPITGVKTYATPNPNSPVVVLTNATDVTPRSQPIASGISVVEYGTTDKYGKSSAYGDSNIQKQQGTIIIESSRVSQSATTGIVLESERDTNGNRLYPGVPTNFNSSSGTTSVASSVPGVVLVNNIINGFGQVGISINGDPNTSGPVAATPFARVVNNTIYGSLLQTGIGIQVGNNASPTLLNNIIANTDTAIQTSTNSTAVIAAELYSNNKQNRTIINPTTSEVVAGDIGNQSFVQPNGQQIFVNPTAGNFYLRPGTQGSPNLAIDSAVDSLGERSDLAALKTSLGMLPSSIVSPTTDINSQSRIDDPSVTTPPGVGNNSFKDRGAIERADFNGPYAFLVTPQDNSAGDANPALGAVTLTAGFGLTKFEVGLADIAGTGIDQQSIDTSDVTLTLNGAILTQGKDYTFNYDLTRNVIVLTSAGAQFRAGTYLITLNNTVNGIVDKAGNPVLPNTSDNKTVFTVVLNLTGPTGTLTAPQDGGPADLNSAANDVTVKTVQGLTVFEVSLAGGVGGINDSSVDSTKVLLFRNGAQLTLGTDYVFSYDPSTNKIRLTSVGQLFIPAQYSIRVNNTLTNGILDNSGNPIQPNRNDGTVVYNATLLLAGPTATVSAPADNGSSDTDPLPNHVQIVRTTGLPEIDVILKQDAAAINASTVTASTVKLYRGGVLLVRGTDYNFAYISGTSTIALTLTDLSKIPADYTVVLDNSATTGIRDLSGARLQPNQSDGTTTFYVSVVTPGPVASLVSPLDGSSADKDPTPNNVLFYSQAAVNQFQILLNQVGFAIDDATVTASKIVVTKDGALLQLGVDYAFSYQASTDTITISSVNSDFQPGIYDIKLDNSATGILDVQGNKLRSNRASGATEFVVSFSPPGPISIPQGIFISNLGLSDFSGSTYIGFNLQGDPLSKVTVTIDAKVDPSGTDTQLLNTTLFVSANGVLSFNKLLPVDLNGETLNITATNEFGQVISASSLIGPRATFARAYVSSLFNDLLGRDGVLNETTDQFSPIESLVTFPAMAQSIIGSSEFANASAAALVKSILGRTATPQEIATYSAQFMSTGSFNQARISLLTSDEFAQLPPDLSLDYNNATHRAAVTSYVQRVYAVLLPGVTLTSTLLNTQVQNIFEGGRKWIITNASDGGILGSLAFKQSQVTQAYVKFLGRTPTTTELNASVNLTDHDLVKSVVTTSDYIDTQLAESIYREYLQLSKSQVDPAKVQALVQSLKNETEDEVRADVLASADFRANSGGTLDSFVENVYRQILLMPPSSTDIANGKSFVIANSGVGATTDTMAGRRAYALLLLSDPSYQNNSEGTLITGGIQSTSSAGAPVISAISQVIISEGQSVAFDVSSTSISGKLVTYSLVDGPTGASIDSQTGKFYWNAPDSFDGILPITVQAADASNPLLKTVQTFLVEVNNVSPTVTVYASSNVIGGTPTIVTLAADDPSSVDENANFTFNIDWNGDGIVDQTVVGPSGLMLQHTFLTPGPQIIIVTAMDKDGGISDPASTTIFVSGVFVAPDMLDPTKQDLYVVGSDGTDNITITQDTKGGPITVLISVLNGIAVNQTYQFTNITGHVEAYGYGGNDIINAKDLKYTAVSIDGGTGNDSLTGGYFNDTVLGGDGNDTIWGGLGNDNIDGGAGNDVIFGDAPNGQGISLTRNSLGKDTIYGGAGNDTIFGDGDGGEGASDYIDAGDGDDTVIADGSEGMGPTGDTILGGAGNDLLFGDSPNVSADKGGNDSIDGGSGNDVIYGGGGADTLSGGTGSDLIIAGYTTNLDVAAFQNIQREWVSDRSFAVRRDSILGKRFDGANAFVFLSPGGTGYQGSNVLEDDAIDSVFAGNDTDGDWILATATVDNVNDAHLNEDIVDSLKP